MKKICITGTLFLIIALFVSFAAITSNLAQEKKATWQNLQILPKDITKAQLEGIMESFTEQLGVECKFCHIINQYPKDDNKHKQIARGMMKMMGHLKENADTYFPKGKADKLRCWTCHRGKAEVDKFVPEE